MSDNKQSSSQSGGAAAPAADKKWVSKSDKKKQTAAKPKAQSNGSDHKSSAAANGGNAKLSAAAKPYAPAAAAPALATASASVVLPVPTVIPAGEYDIYDVPRDAVDSNYVLNFALSEWREIRRFFHCFGFVVIRNVLTEAECAATVSEVHDSLERGTDRKWNRNDQSTWNVWPKNGMEHYASPSKASLFSPQFLRNRTNPNVHAAFAVLFADGGADVKVDVTTGTADADADADAKSSANGAGAGSTDAKSKAADAKAAAAPIASASGTGTAAGTNGAKSGLDTAAVVASCEPILVNHDRCNFFRPTYDHGKWATKSNLHLDMNAWNWLGDGSMLRDHLDTLTYDNVANFINENNQASHTDGLQLQAAINLLDNFTEDGGFICVPGFHSEFVKYYSDPKLSGPRNAVDRANVDYPPKHPLQSRAIRVPMRAGSIVLWDQRLPHGSHPNRGSTRPRCAELLKMFPARLVSKVRAGYRAAAVRAAIRPAMEHKSIPPFVVTELASQLLGFHLPGAGAGAATASATPAPIASASAVSSGSTGGGAANAKK